MSQTETPHTHWPEGKGTHACNASDGITTETAYLNASNASDGNTTEIAHLNASNALCGSPCISNASPSKRYASAACRPFALIVTRNQNVEARAHACTHTEGRARTHTQMSMPICIHIITRAQSGRWRECRAGWRFLQMTECCWGGFEPFHSYFKARDRITRPSLLQEGLPASHQSSACWKNINADALKHLLYWGRVSKSVVQ